MTDKRHLTTKRSKSHIPADIPALTIISFLLGAIVTSLVLLTYLELRF